MFRGSWVFILVLLVGCCTHPLPAQEFALAEVPFDSPLRQLNDPVPSPQCPDGTPILSGVVTHSMLEEPDASVSDIPAAPSRDEIWTPRTKNIERIHLLAQRIREQSAALGKLLWLARSQQWCPENQK